MLTLINFFEIFQYINVGTKRAYNNIIIINL